MKKTFLPLLLSSILLVASCSNNGGDSSTLESNEQSSAESGDANSSLDTSISDSAITNIAFARSTPTEITLGETIDLSQYVTVTPSDASWQILDLAEGTSNVSISGHTITGTGLGSFRVQVVGYNDQTQKKNLEGTVVSEEKAALNELFSSIDSWTTSIYYQGEKIQSAYVTESYWYSSYYGFGSLSLSDGYDYQITDSDGDEIPDTVEQGVNDFSAYFPSLGFPYSSSHLTQVELSNGSFATRIASPYNDTFTYDLAQLAGYSPTYSNSILEIGALEVSLDDVNDPSVVTIKILNGNLRESGYVYELSAINSTSIAYIEDYIASGTIPDKLVPTELIKCHEAINASKNVTLSINCFWSDSSGYSIDMPSDASGYGLNEYDTTVYLDDSSAYITSSSANVAASYAPKSGESDGNFYYSYSEAGGAWSTATDTGYAVSDGLYANFGYGIFDEEFLTSLAYSSHERSDYYGYDAYRLFLTDDSSQTSFSDGTEVNSYLYQLLINSWPFYGGGSEDYAGATLAYYLSVSGYVYLLAEDSGAIQVESFLYWGESQYYFVIATFSNIGTTVVPTSHLSNIPYEEKGESSSEESSSESSVE